MTTLSTDADPERLRHELLATISGADEPSLRLYAVVYDALRARRADGEQGGLAEVERVLADRLQPLTAEAYAQSLLDANAQGERGEGLTVEESKRQVLLAIQRA